MSRYGTVLGGTANAITAVIQSENADDMIPLIIAAVTPLLVGVVDPVATSLTLTGAGDGHMFFLELEGAASVNVDGGARITGAQFFVAATAEALQAQLASMQFNQPIFDVQIAGASKGQRVMAMVLFGTVQPPLECSCTVVWRPDGGGDETTWAGVMRHVAANKGPITIYMPQPSPTVPSAASIVYLIGSGPAISPAEVFDMKGARLVSPLGPHDNIICQIRQTATLHNLAGISGGLRLQASKLPGAPPAFTFASETPGAAMTFTVEDGAELRNEGGADVMILVPPTTEMAEFYLVFNQLGTAFASGDYPVVGAGPQSILNVTVLSGGLSLDTIQPRNWLGGAPDAVVNWIHDGTMAFPQDPSFWSNTGNPANYFPNLLSTINNQPTGCVGGTGPSANRPKFQDGGNPGFGCMYFDTDLLGGSNTGIPIWFTGALGSGWVDATGTVVV